MRGPSRLAGAVSALLLSVAGPLAQGSEPMPVVQDGVTLHLDALGHRLAMPLPSWLSDAERLSADVLDLVVTSYSGDATQALFEMVKAGETTRDWSEIYAARLTLEPARALSDYRQAAMVGYARTCRPELTGFFQLGEGRPDDLPPLGFVCGAFLSGIPGYAGQGEIAIIAFKKTATAVAVVTHEWRGRAFDPTNPSTWPVAAAIVEARAAELHNMATLAVAD